LSLLSMMQIYFFVHSFLFLMHLARLHPVLYNARWWTWHIQGLFQCTRWQHDFALTSFMLILFLRRVVFLYLEFVLGEFWCKDWVWYDPELQSSTGCVQQAENWKGICSLITMLSRTLGKEFCFSKYERKK